MAGTMAAQEYGADDEELTAGMGSKLASAESQRPASRSAERGGIDKFQKLHNRQKNEGGGRVSGQ